MGTLFWCPKCENKHIPLIESKGEYKCVTCGFSIKADTTPTEETTVEDVCRRMDEARKNADVVLKSTNEYPAKISCSLKKEWGRRFAAAKLLFTEGFNLSKEAFISRLIKLGITGLFMEFNSAEKSRGLLKKMADDGILSMDSLNNVLSDIDKFSFKEDINESFQEE